VFTLLKVNQIYEQWCCAGGYIHLRNGANSQYATSSAYLFIVYSDLLAKYKGKIVCGEKSFDSSHLLSFAKKQVSAHTNTPF